MKVSINQQCIGLPTDQTQHCVNLFNELWFLSLRSCWTSDYISRRLLCWRSMDQIALASSNEEENCKYLKLLRSISWSFTIKKRSFVTRADVRLEVSLDDSTLLHMRLLFMSAFRTSNVYYFRASSLIISSRAWHADTQRQRMNHFRLTFQDQRNDSAE